MKNLGKMQFMKEKQKLAYGSWPSPISVDDMTLHSVGLGEIQAYNDVTYWIEMRPEESGRYVIVADDGKEQQDINPAPYNARSRVHEYGGGSYLVCEQGIFFVNFNDQQIYLVSDEVNQITNAENSRFADLVYDKRFQRIIAVCETHSETEEPVNSLVSIDLTSGSLTTLTSGADFYSNPRLNNTCSSLCWIEWNHPNMPWDDTQLCLASINEQGLLENTQSLTSGDNESIVQPVWSPDNKLYFISDRNGWWNIYRHEDDKQICVYEVQAECGVPQWSFCESNYVFLDEKTLILNYSSLGISHLAKLNLNDNSLAEIDVDATDIESLAFDNSKLFFLAANAKRFPSICAYDLKKNTTEVLRVSNELVLQTSDISIGEAIQFKSESGQVAHAFYYEPTNSQCMGLDNELPPLIVMSHGGPTGQAHNGIKMVAQYFTSRGFAVVDVNYGGSSGYGRAYRQRLNKNWGIVDVQDCAAAAIYLAEIGKVDKDRLAIRGGSAGGFTTFASLTFTDVFKVGASHYGVSDLTALAKETHKFESRYLDNLIGAYPEAKDIYEQRSPINATDKLSCPVIFFQGLEDKIVLPNQAEMMVNSLKEKNIPVVYLAYEGEQHGFRQAKNIKKTLKSELAFYAYVFKFERDDLEELVFE